MKLKMNANLPAKFTIQLSLFLGAALLIAGCAIVDGLTGTNLSGNNSPQPPPRASWQAAPGFSAEPLTKIAVIAEDKARRNWGSDDAMVRTVEDQFIAKLLQKGYQVSARSDVAQVLGEIRFQQSGLTEAGAAKLGRMLNAAAVLIVTINGANVNSQDTGVSYNGVQQQIHSASCNMSARLISVEKAEILGITSFTSRVATANRDDASPGILFTAQIIADSIPSRNAQ